MKQKILELIRASKIYGILKSTLYNTQVKDYKGMYLDSLKIDEYLKSLLLGNQPFMVSRLGSVELRTLSFSVKKKKYTWYIKDTMIKNAGFFPSNDNSLDKFSELYLRCINNIDLLGMRFSKFEDVIANRFCPNARLTNLRNLEPYFSENPWSYYLQGKKVLVVHPFASSIASQYKIREKLFLNQEVLPEFSLITYRAIQSVGGNSDFISWFEALEKMQNDISEIDFDVAIIGAGAYGLALASFIKDLGKSSIHLGGATQILFGVYGRRWELKPDFQDFINEHWIKPQGTEKPKNAKDVENACYW